MTHMNVAVEAMPAARDEILARYRRLREIGAAQQSDMLRHVPQRLFMDCARSVGLTQGNAYIAGSEEELTLVLDLAIHAPRNAASRAIERFRKASHFAAGSDDAKVLDAKCAAKFSMWQFKRHHDVAGVIVDDVVRDRETWLVDQGLEQCAREGMIFASRLAWPESFAMTCGAIVPVDARVLELAVDAMPRGGRRDTQAVADDPRFAHAIYRAAISLGMLERTRFV